MTSAPANATTLQAMPETRKPSLPLRRQRGDRLSIIHDPREPDVVLGLAIKEIQAGFVGPQDKLKRRFWIAFPGWLAHQKARDEMDAPAAFEETPARGRGRTSPCEPMFANRVAAQTRSCSPTRAPLNSAASNAAEPAFALLDEGAPRLFRVVGTLQDATGVGGHDHGVFERGVQSRAHNPFADPLH